jgi:CheY-like chemotaxis protein
MTAEQVEKVFTAFEQADSTIAIRFGGTGLGLAISQNLVKQMGGTITVTSRAGEGSVFSFTVNLIKAEAVPESSTGQAGSLKPEDSIPCLRGKRILLAEDIEINRIILGELLSETQVTIDEAVDGQEALDKFAASAEGYYDLIFMDIQMPNLDGYEVAVQLRALKRSDAKIVPIIAMTANAYREDVEKALNSGMNGHVAKPVDLKELMQVLTEKLEDR